MTYTKQTWHDAPATDTPLSAARLSHMEDGIADAVPSSRKVNGKSLSDDVTLDKSDIGLGNVDNTSDADKPVSTATQEALDAKATQVDMTDAQDALSVLSQRLFGLDTTVYVADHTNSRVYQLLPDGTQSTLPITGLNVPRDLELDNSGVLYVANSGASNIIQFDPRTGTQTVIPTTFGSTSVSVDDEGSIYFSYGSICRKRTADGVVTTLGFAGIGTVRGITVDRQGSVYVNDTTNLTVWKLTSAGAQSQLAFTGLSQPWDIAVDDALNVYVADSGVGIQMMSAAGVQSTLAPAAGLGNPLSVTVDDYGNRYFSSASNNRVFRVDAAGVRTDVDFANDDFGNLSGIAVSAVPTYIPDKLILKSPNGTVYALTVDDDGTLTGITIDGGKA